MAVSGEQIAAERARIDESRVALLVAITTLFLALCTFTVGLRGLVKRSRGIKLEVDDYLCFSSFVFFIGYAVTTYMMAFNHVGRHTLFVQELPNAEAVNIAIRNLTVAQQWLHLFTITIVKLSILFLYRRIFTHLVRWFNFLWWACVAMTVVYYFIYAFLIPIQGYPCPLDDRGNFACPFPTPAETYFAPGGAGNASMDLVILLLPVVMVWKLQMSRQNKSALIGIFILGSAAVAVSFARATLLGRYYTEPDPIYGHVNSVLFGLAEPGTAIICSCLPVLRPLLQITTYRSLFSKGSSSSSNNNSSGSNRYFSGNGNGNGNSNSSTGSKGSSSKLSGSRTGPGSYIDLHPSAAKDRKGSNASSMWGRRGRKGSAASDAKGEDRLEMTDMGRGASKSKGEGGEGGGGGGGVQVQVFAMPAVLPPPPLPPHRAHLKPEAWSMV